MRVRAKILTAGLAFAAVAANAATAAETAEEILARYKARTEVVSAIPHYAPCTRDQDESDILVCADANHRSQYLIEREESPFGGRLKGLSLEEVTAVLAEGPWGKHIDPDRPTLGLKTLGTLALTTGTLATGSGLPTTNGLNPLEVLDASKVIFDRIFRPDK